MKQISIAKTLLSISLCLLSLWVIPFYSNSTLASIENSAQQKEQLLDQIIVIVNDSVILQSALQHRLKQITQSLPKGRKTPPKHVLVKQVLDRMILETIQLQMAEQLGIRVGDNELNSAIMEIAQQNKLTFDEFKRELARQNIPYVEFREQIRRDMLLSQVQKRHIGKRIQVTEQDADTFLSSPLGKEQLAADYHIHHILLAFDEENSIANTQAVEKQANQLYEQLVKEPSLFPSLAVEHSDSSTALDGGDLGWRPVKELPTLFADQAVLMKVGEISRPIKSSSGFHIIRLSDRRGETERIVRQFKVRHILIKPNEIRSSFASKRLIEEIHSKLNRGSNSFEQLAKTYSDDTGSARNGGDLGWVSPGQMVPQFEKVMNQTSLNQISIPFESTFGWHILQVTDARSEDFSDEFRVAQAKNFVYKRKFEEELPIWLREIRQNAFVKQKISMEVLSSSFSLANQ